MALLPSSTENVVQDCLSLVRMMLFPSYYAFNGLVSLYFVTFSEEQNYEPSYILLKQVVLTPIFASMFILFTPILCLFLPLRCWLASKRRPYVYSEHRRDGQVDEATNIRQAIHSGQTYKFGVSSANICLMPEFLSRMNHLTQVDERSVQIGRGLLDDQLSYTNHTNSDTGCLPTEGSGHINGKIKPANSEQVIGRVSEAFPRLNVLCLQEAWSSYHNKALITSLHQWFPYIVHDVACHSFNVNRFCLSSGHLVASKHPIEAVEFKTYKNFIFHGHIISMGVLMLKLCLLQTENGDKKVAYVFNTHLQSYQQEHNIILKQLDELLGFSEQFMSKNGDDRDDVVFTSICGDFNMDNMSPADHENTRHRIFEVYEDFARVEPGVEKSWSVGTELRQDRMLDLVATTSDGLKQVLDDQVLRQCYILDGDIKEHSKEEIVCPPIKLDDEGNVKVIPEGGRRRIDYVLLHKKDGVEIQGYHFVTRLASLTDHIPVAIEFTSPKLCGAL